MDLLQNGKRIAGLVGLLLLPAAWAGWQPVATLGNERVELDVAGALRQADGSVLVWNRWQRDGVWLDDAGRRYSSIEVLNHYLCRERSVQSLRRLWRLDGRVVHEEGADPQPPRPVRAGSLEARLLAAACRSAPVAAVVAGEDDRPRPMHADLLGSGRTSLGPLAIADVPGRPRFIDLPKIDPAQLEKPQQVPVSPPSPPSSEPGAAENKAPRSAALSQPAPRPQPAGESVAAQADRPLPPAARSAIERQYASSGPRRAAPKKAEVVHGGADKAQWSYEGVTGPRHWGKLDAKFALCDQGKRQSPIDIRDGIKVDLEPIRFHYRPTPVRVVNNGHTIQVEVPDGMSMRVGGRDYQLRHFHFHRPSEERIDGMAFDMVIHLVHRDYDDNLAVIAVLLEAGGEHPVIQTLWNHLPLEVGDRVAVAQPIDLNELLPAYRGYYTYMGSLTTPPCSEGVLWLVFKQPLMVSPQQIATFARLYRNNARPIQPSHGRLIKESR